MKKTTKKTKSTNNETTKFPWKVVYFRLHVDEYKLIHKMAVSQRMTMASAMRQVVNAGLENMK